MYAVHVVAIATQLLPILSSNAPTVVWSSADHQNCAPRSAVLSPRGDLAVVFGTNVGRPRSIYVRSRGRRPETLEVPGAAAASEDRQLFQQYFEDVAISPDGAIFAIAATFFEGGYSGASEVPMMHVSGGYWTALRLKTTLDTTNLSIAAVASRARFAVNGDFDNTIKNLDLAAAEPNYQRPQAALVDGSSATSLGYVVVTNMRAGYISGYASSNPWDPPPGNRLPPAAALLWHDGVRSKLGSGVAYDVNAHGIAVGSDEALLGRAGRPVVWQAGVRTEIGTGDGMAYAIDGAGTVVGSIGQRAFISTSRNRAQPAFFDALVDDKSWHINTAYGIANDGEILAIGHRRGQRSKLLMLSRDK